MNTPPQEQDKRLYDIRGYDYSFDDPTSPDKEWADDGAVGIVRSGVCHVFYRGQGPGEFTDKHIPQLKEAVDKALKEAAQ